MRLYLKVRLGIFRALVPALSGVLEESDRLP